MARDKNFGVAGRLGGIGGTYGRKAENLTKKELKKAGGAKAAAGPNVDITKTTRDYSRGITLGPKGKPLTGRVKLQNGNMAVYKAGKRVIAAAPGKKAPIGAGNGSGGGGRGATETPPTGNKLRAAAMKRATADSAKRKSAGNAAQVGAMARVKSETDARKRKAAGMPGLNYKANSANTTASSSGTDLTRAQRLAKDNVMRKTRLSVNNTPASDIAAVQRSISLKKQAIRNLTDQKNRTAAEDKRLREQKAQLTQLQNSIKTL